MSVRYFLILAFLFGAAEAQAHRRILLYPQTNSISYTAQPGQTSCRMSVNETESAEVLDENDNYLKVRFPAGRMHGCFGESLLGRDIDVGWVSKSEISYGEDDSSPAQISNRAKKSDRAAICPPPGGGAMKEPSDIRDTKNAIRQQGFGLKPVSDFSKYMNCYPLSAKATQNYAAYEPIMDKIADSFSFSRGGADYEVNPLMFRCLLRRESEFDPQSKSTTGAVGLGQHTTVNILHIKNRLAKKENWERQLWDRFFTEMKHDPQGRALLAQCPRTARGGAATFNDKEDAACPLQSMAASAIYNLQIQESLRRSSKVKKIGWKDELDYQVAIGATYNLGDGAAAKAVNDLVVSDWISAIQKRAPNPGKFKEVSNHVTALRNCMEGGNWKPMFAGDVPSRRCEARRGGK